ncbi:MAG: response regulator [Pyrinomonadaceae bacterium]
MSKHKLLLADDSITIQKVVNLTFADEGIEVISVGDGNSAMAKFEEFTPDLVMVDINMPGLSGYEICERIKQNEATRRIPVILLVGSFEPFDEAEAQRVGANDYLTKPFQSIRQLVTKVSDLLNSSADEESPLDNAAPVNSFDDTLRMDKPFPESEELGDAGMDDDMIQANQVGAAAYDESYKFESQPETESDDYGKTQPLSAEELSEINSYQNQEPTDLSNQSIYGFTGETDNRGQDYADDETDSTDTQELSADENEFSSQPDKYQPTPMPETASVLELDEMNLLELPPRQSFSPNVPAPPVLEDNFVPAAEPIEDTDETREEETLDVADETSTEESLNSEDETPQAETFNEVEYTQPEVFEEEETSASETNEAETIEAESTPEESAVSAEPMQMTNLSPEIIDAIAAKVVEKISDQVIREIAWEVVPQMTDLIVKRLAEEKLKE